MQLLLAPVLLTVLASQSRPTEKLPLRLLYTGTPTSAYTADWEKFLVEHAASVRVVPATSLRVEDLTDIDVLVVDGEVETRGKNGELRLAIQRIPLTLEDLQGKPVVLMGGQGGAFADDLHLKLSWRHG
jgi:hypothetical protein